MEDDKKRSKNKKKKIKQATRLTESVTEDERESTSKSKIHVLDIEQNSNVQISGVIDSSKDVGGNIDVDRGGNHANSSEGSKLDEAEKQKQYWLDRDEIFQEKVNELEAEKDAQIQKEAPLKLGLYLVGTPIGNLAVARLLCLNEAATLPERAIQFFTQETCSPENIDEITGIWLKQENEEKKDGVKIVQL